MKKEIQVKICTTCGKEFTKQINRSVKSWSTAKFCSQKCRKSSQETKDKIRLVNTGRPYRPYSSQGVCCKNCGKTFRVWNAKIKNGKGKYCSTKCFNKYNSGENHIFWKGGLSHNIYPVDWTNSLRISIRERDKYTCQLCGEKQGDIAHAVHHIDYDKKNCNPSNLITLCKSCHAKTNSNREYWLKSFGII